MTEVLCTIKNCTHWEDEHCRLNVIKVDGNAEAARNKETLCASFAARDDVAAEAGAVDASPNTQL